MRLFTCGTCLCLSLVLLANTAFQAPVEAATLKNLIIVIGDGMGYEQIKATGMYFNGREGTLNFEAFPAQAEMTTQSASHAVTDSAAAATAMATGVKTVNGYVGRDRYARDVPNITELAKLSGKSTGLLTTVSVAHATPAGFGAHEDFRGKNNGIVDSILSDTRPNLLWGATQEINPAWCQFKNYELVSSSMELSALNNNLNNRRIAGLFHSIELPWEYEAQGPSPRLHEMTRKALQMLSSDQDGFFLMVEGGKIDWASHHGDLFKTVHEVQGLARSVNEILVWMKGRDDTLLIVTADHETGGLKVGAPRGLYQLPEHTWTAGIAGDGTLTHTGVRVPMYAIGNGATEFSGALDNTEIFTRSIRLMGLQGLHKIMSSNL